VSILEEARATATILDGKALAEELRAELRAECEALAATLGFSPALAVLSVGEDPAARSYVIGIKRACERVGIVFRPVVLPGDCDEETLRGALIALNEEPEVCGVLVTLPLPAHLSPDTVATTLSPEKDIDGITLVNAGRLSLGRRTFAPNTPAGGMEMLRRHQIPVAGRHAVIVGRGGIVGRPMASMLLNADATVTICHSRTPDLAAHVREADIVVAAAGRPHLLNGEMLKPGATVIDFGINFPEWSNGKMVGDVDFASALAVAGAITPVPGGTGPVTNMMLMRNTLAAARARAEEE
jgi:methylenetetrahydrofolate dehydrogenase (NADP+) / methenyltetrahydrofolate cyclohydrolase